MAIPFGTASVYLPDFFTPGQKQPARPFVVRHRQPASKLRPIAGILRPEYHLKMIRQERLLSPRVDTDFVRVIDAPNEGEAIFPLIKDRCATGRTIENVVDNTASGFTKSSGREGSAMRGSARAKYRLPTHLNGPG